MKSLCYENVIKLATLFRSRHSLGHLGRGIDRVLAGNEHITFGDKRHLSSVFLNLRLSEDFSVKKNEDRCVYLRQIYLCLDAIIEIADINVFGGIVKDEQNERAGRGNSDSEFLVFLYEIMEDKKFKAKKVA